MRNDCKSKHTITPSGAKRQVMAIGTHYSMMLQFRFSQHGRRKVNTDDYSCRPNHRSKWTQSNPRTGPGIKHPISFSDGQ